MQIYLGDLPPTRRADIDADDATIRKALRSGELVARRRGVLVGQLRLQAVETHRDQHVLATQIAIASTPGPPTYACLGSAGAIHGFSRLGRTPERVRLYRRSGSRWRDDQVAVLVCGLPAHHVETRESVACTTAARTAVDLSRWVMFRSGVVVADSALRLGVTRQEMERVARDCAHWPGIRKAREVIAFADGLAATPLESISRVAFRDMGLPPPELQVTLEWDEFGNPKYIVDFYWPEFRVVGEADGLMKYDKELNPDGLALQAEKLRQEELEALGYIVVRWNWEQIWRRPEWVAWRLRNAMAEGARRRRTA